MKASPISFSIRVLAGVAALAFAPWACAHAHPKQESPRPGATVAADQTQVWIEFDDALEPDFSSLQVADARGQ